MANLSGIINDNLHDTNFFTDKYNSHYKGKDGSNGLTGFKTWECYMLIKYGYKDSFNLSGKKQYLIELPLYPEQVTESISTNWNTQPILGRSSPIAAYAGTDLKRVNFDLDLHRDFLTGSYSLTSDAMMAVGGQPHLQAAGNQKQSGTGPFDTRAWYVNINKMLQMACYPQYTDAGLIPPTTYFIFGQMILKGFVDNYSTTWKKPIINTFYGWNSVSIQMSCYPDTIISAHEMIEGTELASGGISSGATSTQNTYNTPFPGRGTTNADVMDRNFNRSNFRASTAGTPGGNILDT